MEKKDVPQDKGILEHYRVVCYAADENGGYGGFLSAGWEPTNIANGIAWEFIKEELAETEEKVRKGELSPLAYHMHKYLMDVKILSGHMGFTVWRVKRHLKPRPFAGLKEAILERYAAVFGMTVAQLKEVP